MLCLWWLQVTPVATVNNIPSINAVESVTQLSSCRSVFACRDFSYSISSHVNDSTCFSFCGKNCPFHPPFLSSSSVPSSLSHPCVALSHSSRVQLVFPTFKLLRMFSWDSVMVTVFWEGIRLIPSTSSVCLFYTILVIVCERVLVELRYVSIFPF